MTSRPSTPDRSSKRSARIDRRESLGSLLRFILTVALIAWALRSLVGAPFNIPSGSMLPTLYIGDYLAVTKWPYGYSRFSFPLSLPSFQGRVLAHVPKRGDVVGFRHPSENSDLIKRVIGLPGDSVAVHDGRLILNGRPVPRQPLPPATVAISPNSPCRVVPPASPLVAEMRGQAFCMYKAYRETLPGGVSYTVLDELDHGPA